MYAIKILKIIVSLHIFTRKILFNLRFISCKLSTIITIIMKSFMYDTPVKIRKVVVKRRTKPYTIICKKVNWKVTKCNSLLKKFKALLANIKRLFPPFCCDLINCFHCTFQVEVHQTGDHSCLLQLYWNHNSAWAFSCKFAAYFQITFL